MKNLRYFDSIAFTHESDHRPEIFEDKKAYHLYDIMNNIHVNFPYTIRGTDAEVIKDIRNNYGRAAFESIEEMIYRYNVSGQWAIILGSMYTKDSEIGAYLKLKYST